MIVLLESGTTEEAERRILDAIRALGLDAVPLEDVKGKALEVLGADRGRVLALRGTPGVLEILTRRTALTGGEPVWPHFVLRAMIVSILVFVVLILLSAFAPPGLDDTIEPGTQTHSPAAEWYLRPVISFQRLFPGSLRGTALVFVGLFWVVFFLWPFLDRADGSTPRGRKVVLGTRVMGFLLVVFLLLLVFWGTP